MIFTSASIFQHSSCSYMGLRDWYLILLTKNLEIPLRVFGYDPVIAALLPIERLKSL